MTILFDNILRYYSKCNEHFNQAPITSIQYQQSYFIQGKGYDRSVMHVETR